MTPSTDKHGSAGVALVLGAGGTKGWAHIGVVKVLHDAGVPVDLIVGASAGALIGPLYAVRRDAAGAERVAMGYTPTEFLDWFLRDLRISPRAGRMGRSLWQVYGRLDFRELAVPFAAVALDLASGKLAVLRDGNVGRAVEASIRSPLIGSPVRDSGRALVDGGLHNTVPVGVASELGATKVISVNVGEFLVLPRRLRPLAARVGLACRARSANPADASGRVGFLADLLSKGHPSRGRADIEIRPNMRGISPMWPWHIHTAMQRGHAAARRALPAIQRLLAVQAA
jgi:predicted acylesterase/phospholipase RssA